MKGKNNNKKKIEKRSLTDKEVTALLSTIKNSGQGGNVQLQKKALDILIKNGGVNKLLEANK